MPPANPFRDRLWQIMWLQQQNLRRMDEGVILEGTYGDGLPRTLRSKTPELIRLIDQPERLMVSLKQIHKQPERILTIMPLADDPNDGGIVGRQDRNVSYCIHGAVWLTDAELQLDKQELMENNRLAVKLEALAEDTKLLVLDNLNLCTADVPQGFVDDQVLAFRYDHQFAYPAAAFFCTVQGAAHWC